MCKRERESKLKEYENEVTLLVAVRQVLHYITLHYIITVQKFYTQ